MKKSLKMCFLLLLLILIMNGCNKETNRTNDIPQNKSTSSQENTTQLSPVPKVDNSDTISPAPDSQDNSDTTSPTPDTENTSDTITTPILVKGLFMGGISEGQWLQPDEFYQDGRVILESFSYDVYKDGSNSGTAIGGLPTSWMTGEPVQGDQYDQEFCIVELFDKDQQRMAYDIALQAKWNLFPRTYQVQDTEQTYYMNLMKEHLKGYGLENPETTIKQIIKVDLDGEGTDEVLIAADNTIDYQFEEVKKGDNAVLLFRKLVDGEVMNQVIEQDIRVKEEEYPSLYRILSRVDMIADLDGDNELEVIIKSWYYEGAFWSIYKLIDNRLELVTSNGYGA